MRVDDIEASVTILLLEEMPGKRLAHFLGVIEKVVIGTVRAVMVPDALYLEDTAGAVTRPGKHVHQVALALQRQGQFGDMRGDATHRYRIQGFP